MNLYLIFLPLFLQTNEMRDGSDCLSVKEGTKAEMEKANRWRRTLKMCYSWELRRRRKERSVYYTSKIRASRIREILRHAFLAQGSPFTVHRSPIYERPHSRIEERRQYRRNSLPCSSSPVSPKGLQVNIKMAKSKSKASATTTTNTTSSPPPNLTTSLPSLILTSKALEPTTLIESQVTLLPNLLSKKECNSLIDHFSSSTYQLVPSPAPKKGEALRTNSRIGFQDPAFAKRLWNELGMKGIVEGWESLDGKAKGKGKKPVGLNGNIRM